MFKIRVILVIVRMDIEERGDRYYYFSNTTIVTINT